MQYEFDYYDNYLLNHTFKIIKQFSPGKWFYFSRTETLHLFCSTKWRWLAIVLFIYLLLSLTQPEQCAQLSSLLPDRWSTKYDLVAKSILRLCLRRPTPAQRHCAENGENLFLSHAFAAVMSSFGWLFKIYYRRHMIIGWWSQRDG